MFALFDDSFLNAQIAMRGGPLLHKVHLAPPARYSEDIDLVVVGSRPAEHIRRAIRRVLADVLGAPRSSIWDTIALAIRNITDTKGLRKNKFTFWRERRAGRCKAPRRRRCGDIVEERQRRRCPPAAAPRRAAGSGLSCFLSCRSPRFRGAEG